MNKIHAVNRSAILDYIRRHGPTSRPSIAKDLHFSLPTVMRIIDELTAEGLVIETGETEYSGGRRRPLLELNSKDNLIIGIDMGGTEIYGAVTDFSGAVLAECRCDNPPSAAEKSYARLAGLIRRLLGDEKIAGRKILGLAVGLQGYTDNRKGVVIRDPIQGWFDYPLRDKLAAEFSLPIVIDNDVNLAALGEHWFGVDQNARNLVFITIGNGIGAGLILDGSLYRSTNAYAGEIGYFLPDRKYLGTHRDDFGTLESLAALNVIAEKAQDYFRKQHGTDGGEHATPEGIFKAMLAKEAWAQNLIDDMVDLIAIAVANTAALLDPDLVVLRSSLDQYTELLIEPIMQRISNLVPVKPRLEASKLGYKATALGAIVEVLYDTTTLYSLRKLR